MVSSTQKKAMACQGLRLVLLRPEEVKPLALHLYGKGGEATNMGLSFVYEPEGALLVIHLSVPCHPVWPRACEY
eukprot:1161172-Pelagomonas_calceolata.AAC.5